MYKFKPDQLNVYYHEMPQANPLRWQAYYREGDTFYPQTNRFMCKDYLNDFAARYNNYDVVAYGLDNKKIKVNEDGLWLRLYNVYDTDVLMTNINTCINKENPDYPLTMEVVPETETKNCVLVHIPRYYFNQTYLISVVSYVIRISNRLAKFRSFDTMLSSTDARSDRALLLNGMELFRGWKYTVPEAFQKYWLWHSESYNSLNGLATLGHGSSIHNCGAETWAGGLSAAQRRNLPVEAAVAA